jgi:WD40 repeat protein
MPSLRRSPRLPRRFLVLLAALVLTPAAAGQPPPDPGQPPSRQQQYALYLAQAEKFRQAGNPKTAELLLLGWPTEDRGWEWHYLKRVCKTGQASHTLTPGERCSAFSPDDYGFAADGPENTVVYRDAETGEQAGTLRGHRFPVRRLAFDPSGELLASAGWDDGKETEVKVWRLPDGPALHELTLPGRVTWLGFNDDPPRLVCQHVDPAGTSTELTVFETQSGDRLFSRTVPGKAVVTAQEPGGSRLATASFAGAAAEVKVWDLVEGKPLLTLDGPGAAPASLTFGPDRRTLALQTAAGNRLWLLGTGERLNLFDPGLPLLFHPDGRCLALVRVGPEGAGDLRLCDATTGNEEVTLKGCRTTPVFSRTGDRLVAQVDRELHFWESATGQEVFTMPGPPPAAEGRDEPRLGFSDDGDRLVAGTTVWDGTVEPVVPPTPYVPTPRSWKLPPLSIFLNVSWLIGLAALFPVIWVSSFLHELGHAVLGKWAGFRVTSFGMGVARPLWVGSWGRTRVYVCRSRPLQGITFSFLPQMVPSRGQLVASLAGGVVAQAVLLVVAGLLWWFVPWGQPVWVVTAVYNLLGVVMNLVPMTVKVGQFTLQSDGAQILRVLRTGGLGASGLAGIRTVRALRPLWAGVGDVLGLYVHLVGAGNTWLALGDAEEAGRLSAEAEALPLTDEPEARCLGLLLRSCLARVGGRLDEADRLLDEADALYAGRDHALGRWLVRGERAEVLLARGEARRALAEFEAMATDPAIAVRPAMASALLTPRLCAVLALEGAAGVERLADEYRATRKKHPSASGDVRLFVSLARWHAAREQWAEAGKAYRQVLTVAAKLHRALTDPPDRDRFLANAADLRKEARECFVRQGAEEEKAATEVDAFFTPAKEAEQRDTRKAEASRRRWLWAGRILIVLDAAAAVAVAARYASWEDALEELRAGGKFSEVFIAATGYGVTWPPLVITLLLACAVALVVGAVLGVAGRFVPKLRQAGGKLFVWLAFMPWLGWLCHFLIGDLMRP